jgi:coenzyme F420-0:L-glutamate ligase / coenzyme F420-1:gamma-L-glutamate ligase
VYSTNQTAPLNGDTEPPHSLVMIALEGVPLIRPGDNLVRLIVGVIQGGRCELRHGDVLVIAQKVISKAEGRYVDLAAVRPSTRAVNLAKKVQTDARFVEVILRESRRVVRHRPGALIVEHRLGFVMANAGVDRSNVDPNAGAEPVLLLPEDPDGTAEHIRAGILQHCAKQVGVIINDSFGRAWRRGTVGIALGTAGLPALLDLRGDPDIYGRPLRVSEIGFADEIAAAASLLMGQADEGLPIILVRGLRWSAQSNPAAALVRNAEEDLFR